MAETAFFQDSYAQCRAAFLAMCSRYPDAMLREIKVQSKSDDDLYIDAFYLPARKEPARMILLTSGVHGIEGFAGSAVQQLFLEEFLPDIDHDATGILLIHGINPHGFKHRRRVTEANVDLNRNFFPDRGLFQTESPGYDRACELLNPEGPAFVATHLRFAAGCCGSVFRAGIPAFRQAILGGQYRHPKGIFFGGCDFEPQNATVSDLICKSVAGYESLLFIDLHTGYGTRGKLHLLDLFEDDENHARVDSMFAGFPIVGRDPEDEFYQVSGDFQQFITGSCSNGRTVIPMTFEFGTANTLGLAGGFTSLRTMVLENQMVQFGARTLQDEETIRQRFLEMFYPSDSKWRKAVIEQTREVLGKVVKRFEERF